VVFQQRKQAPKINLTPIKNHERKGKNDEKQNEYQPIPHASPVLCGYYQ